ncbi:AMIN-like domain-containing (lipo)protein [Hyalangium sp.]|uniref:AMIN-like domain-containing (lipo)protein n=1 Tax=Hyalangium sp. TaxID=2028555 RepID=UPI002D663746|nr:hypothetical protein [Hyalangium sp.]HYH94649.1 hypothetical protein [Hyalangium sp.]
MMQAKRFSRGVKSLWLAGCLIAAGCSKKAEPAPQTEPAPQLPTAGSDSAPPPAPPPLESAAPGTPPAPAQGSATPEDPKNREWTAGDMKQKRADLQMVTLRSVRAARNEGFDRVVFEFDGTQVPGYQLEYVDKPIIKCGSGDPTEVAGQSWLQVSLTPAQAHEGPQVTVTERERKPGLPVIQELELTCDFEGEVTWVLGNAHPNKYRVMELHEPTRLVVDVQH